MDTNNDSLLIRADGSKSIGMGHITRNLDLADYLIKKKLYRKIFFLIKKDQQIKKFIEEKNHNVLMLAENLNFNQELKAIKEILAGRYFKDIILDVLEYDRNKKYTGLFKKFCSRLIAFTDDTYKRIIDCDIVFAFSINQKSSFYKDVKGAKYYLGLKFMPLQEQFAIKKKRKIQKHVSRILITFGGSDSNNFTEKIATLFKKNSVGELTTIITGFSYGREKELWRITRDMDNVIVKRNVKNMYSIISNTDLAVCSTGNTLLELMALGAPCLVLPHTKRENEHAAAYEKYGSILKTTNYGKNVNDQEVIKLLKILIGNFELRKKMSKNSMRLVDGKSCSRIYNILKKKRYRKDG